MSKEYVLVEARVQFDVTVKALVEKSQFMKDSVESIAWRALESAGDSDVEILQEIPVTPPQDVINENDGTDIDDDDFKEILEQYKK